MEGNVPILFDFSDTERSFMGFPPSCVLHLHQCSTPPQRPPFLIPFSGFLFSAKKAPLGVFFSFCPMPCAQGLDLDSFFSLPFFPVHQTSTPAFFPIGFPVGSPLASFSMSVGRMGIFFPHPNTFRAFFLVFGRSHFSLGFQGKCR